MVKKKNLMCYKEGLKLLRRFFVFSTSISIFLLCFIVFSIKVQANAVYLNGNNIQLPSISKNGTIYVPTGPFAVALRTYDAWYPDIKTVLYNGRYFQDWIFTNGRMYVPLRELTDASGGTFRVDGSGAVYVSATPDTAQSARNISVLPAVKTTSTTTTVPLPKVSPLNSVPAPYEPKLPQREPSVNSDNSIYSFPSGNNTPQIQTNNSNDTGMATVYSGSTAKGGGVISPRNAQGGIGDGLRLPADPKFSGISAPDTSFSTLYSYVPSHPVKGAFEPKTEKNQIYTITVTNIEEVSNIKNTYNASAGSKYIVVYISQQNISPEVQIYTGKFTIVDENSKVYDYLEGLSNYWLAILKPGGTNYGYLVFEVPQYARPMRLVLNALSQPPLEISLSR